MDLQKRREALVQQLQQTAIQLEQIKGALAIIDELVREGEESETVNGSDPS
jgi:hypothetical protein